MAETKRDIRFDVLKGFAAILVVLGHVIQFSVKGYENSIIFNIIWSVQMPLFMIIAGYFSLTKKENNLKNLLKSLFSYLWPFITFFILRCIISKYSNPLDYAYELIWHIDGSLWFLFVLAIFKIAHFFGRLFSKDKNNFKGFITYSFAFFIFIVLYISPSVKLGFNFIGIKYVMYYSFFFYFGYIWHLLQNTKIANYMNSKKLDIIAGIFSITYFVIIINFNLYLASDTNIPQVLLRLLCSILGCYMIIYFVFNCKLTSKFANFLSYIGSLTLEIYYIHLLWMKFFCQTKDYTVYIFRYLYVALCFAFVFFVTVGIILLIRKSGSLNFIVFGKYNKKEELEKQ